MLLDLVSKHADIIRSWTIRNLDGAGPHFRFKAEVTFVDGSVLYIRQVVLEETTFKYAYHWQDRDGQMIRRWDNSPHWQNIATHPHHKHLMNQGKVVVMESRGGALDDVFEEIAAIICTP